MVQYERDPYERLSRYRLHLLRRRIDHSPVGAEMKLGTTCAVHRHWSAVPIELHHVWPLGDGGPDVPANKIPVCANGHYEIHACLDLMRVAPLTWRQEIKFGGKVRKYASTGWAQIVASHHDAKQGPVTGA